VKREAVALLDVTRPLAREEGERAFPPEAKHSLVPLPRPVSVAVAVAGKVQVYQVTQSGSSALPRFSWAQQSTIGREDVTFIRYLYRQQVGR
jgi:hypothetical protein